MFGIKHIRFDAMTYVIHYKNGKIKKEGRGLSFFYFAPNSSIVAVPLGSNDLPFIFETTTKDYQTVSIQGQITYKVEDPKTLSNILDFTVDDKGKYKKNDLEKLNQRIINEAQAIVMGYTYEKELKEALGLGKIIEQKIVEQLKGAQAINMLGVNIIGVNIIKISAMPDMQRALETHTREKLQQDADKAIYERRNFAVEQERKIKESELNTKIALEEKNRQIVLKQMETERTRTQSQYELEELRLQMQIKEFQLQQELIQEKIAKERKRKELEMQLAIDMEKKQKELIRLKNENLKAEAEAQGIATELRLRPYKNIDWRVLLALQSNGTDPKTNIAVAFRELAENAQQIQNLNITPDLLQAML